MDIELLENNNLVHNKRLYVGFKKAEAQAMISALKRRISDNNRSIRKVENNPRNEGQVYYSERIKELRYDNEWCNSLIELFTKFITAHGN